MYCTIAFLGIQKPPCYNFCPPILNFYVGVYYDNIISHKNWFVNMIADKSQCLNDYKTDINYGKKFNLIINDKSYKVLYYRYRDQNKPAVMGVKRESLILQVTLFVKLSSLSCNE